MSTRRQFLVSLSMGLLAVPLGVSAQQRDRVPRVGFLVSRRRPESLDSDDQWGAILRGLRELGYVEGRSLHLEWRFADSKYDRLSELAAQLVRLKVDVIVTDGTPSTRAAQKATETIPIIFANVADPADNGVVRSLGRPGGNTTGIANLVGDTCVKQMEMLSLLVPGLSRLAVVFNPGNGSSVPAIKRLRAAAQSKKVSLFSIEVRDTEDLEKGFALMTAERADAFIWVPDPVLFELRRQGAELAVKHRLPSAAMNPEFPRAGGLMSYGQSVSDNYRRAATYVDKILTGANPAELPVEQPTKLELVINRKTAKALGLTIPPELLVLADKVID